MVSADMGDNYLLFSFFDLVIDVAYCALIL